MEGKPVQIYDMTLEQLSELSPKAREELANLKCQLSVVKMKLSGCYNQLNEAMKGIKGHV